jgi:hypothetical protein
VKVAAAAGWKVTIVSSDKDLMQLIVDGQVDMYDTMNDRRIGVEQVIEKFGVGPEKVGEVLALMGDSVDNVPGVPGVGPKTASQLIQDYGSVEGVLAHLDEIKKPKLKQNLTEHAEMARLSRQLVELVCDAPLPEPIDGLAMKGIPDAPLREFLEYHGFKTLLGRLNGKSGAAATATDRAHARPHAGGGAAGARRSTAASTRRSPPRRRSTAGSPSPRAAASWRSTPRRTGATASPPSWSASASRSNATWPATSRSSMAATTCSPSGPSSCRRAGPGQAEAAARGPAFLKIGHN